MKKRVLFAEDSPVILKMGSKILESFGCEVIPARDGIETLEKIYTTLPDSIILDLSMPYFNGIQICQIVKAEPYFKSIPLFILTAQGHSIHEYWARVSGVDGYFTKPEGMEDWHSCFKEILSLMEKQETSSLAPPAFENLPQYLGIQLFDCLTIENLGQLFEKKLKDSHSLEEVGIRSVEFLESLFGKAYYFVLLQEKFEFFLGISGVSPFSKESRELEGWIQNHYHKWTKKPFPPGYTSKILPRERPYSLDIENFHSFAAPVCSKDCEKFLCHLSGGGTDPFPCASSSLGLIGIFSKEPLIEKIDLVMAVTAKQLAGKTIQVLLEKELESAKPLKAYVNLLQTLNTCDSLEEVVEKGLKSLGEFSHSPVGVLFRFRQKDQKLTAFTSFGMASSALLDQTFSLGEGLVGLCAMERKTRVEDFSSFPIPIDTGLGTILAKEVVLLPLIFREILLGIVVLGAGAYSKEKIQDLEGMTSQFSVAVHGARASQEARENTYKGELLASLSHEVRTPLNAVIGYTSSVLEDSKLIDGSLRENISRARQSARGLLDLINNILDLSKIEGGKMETFIENIDLRDLVEDFRITVEGLPRTEGVELKWEISEDLAIIRSDYTKLIQIFQNLLGNAIKFTSEGQVIFRMTNSRSGVLVEVEDTGIGIESERISSIFESFRQCEKDTAKKYGGSGLGLAIVKRITDMLGLSIKVRSQKNEGTVFSLILPLSISEV